MNTPDQIDFAVVAAQIKQWGYALGFNAVGITDTDLTEAENHLHNWLAQDRHGDMHYMEKHGSKRTRPAELVAKTIRIISVRMDYWPAHSDNAEAVLNNPEQAYVSRYALGRDYHKVMRNKLQKLANQIETAVGDYSYRAFVDSAPVMEKALAEKAGLGWIGKHSNLLSQTAGSWFFLGELYTDLPLPTDNPAVNHCGKCSACIDACPTKAIVGPYQVDARRCISYHTIELFGPIPIQFRKAMGNRIYGCDDCQLVCPWNRFSAATGEQDFTPRHKLDSAKLVELFAWSEAEFNTRMEGSAIRRIGHERWLRNIAVALGNALGNAPGNALGNAPGNEDIIRALRSRSDDASELVREHVAWGLAQHAEKQASDD